MTNDYIPSEDVEAPLSVTLRTGAGYDAALLTIRGNDAVQLIARLAELEVNDGLAKVVEFNAALQAKAGAAPSAAPAGGSPSRPQGAPQGAAPQNSEVTFHPEGLTCSAANCGQAVRLKKGVSKAGNPYSVWTCPNQKAKNDGHYSEYIR